jgi:hypothetical protein
MRRGLPTLCQVLSKDGSVSDPTGRARLPLLDIGALHDDLALSLDVDVLAAGPPPFFFALMVHSGIAGSQAR